MKTKQPRHKKHQQLHSRARKFIPPPLRWTSLLLASGITLGILLGITLLFTSGKLTAYGAPIGDINADQDVNALTANPFKAANTAITATVVLGESQPVSLTLANTATVGLTPLLYEAQAVPAPGASLQATIPPDLQRVGLPVQSERIDPQITQELQQSPDGQTDFLVFLNDQPDLSAAYTIDDWGERGWFVYRTLSEHAEHDQRDVRAWLSARGLSYRPFWIVNAILVHGSQADVQALAGRSDVALLHSGNDVASIPDPDEGSGNEEQGAALAADATIIWNIQQIQADRVWADYGVSGQGVVVANIDTGVSYQHPALVQQYRGYRADGTFQYAYNWYDAPGGTETPFDPNGHGTHVMGTMVARGLGSATTPAVGVAPGARWIAARGCESNTCQASDLIAAAQWLLTPSDPDGKNPRPDLRPHIINNSWAGSSDDHFYLNYVTAWRAAGIFPVFVSGNNYHSECSTVVSPGDYSNVFTVGATSSDDDIASFSAIGPAPDGTLKPDLMAPGDDISSTYASQSYRKLKGTSMAAPHVAGAVALLWSANPALVGDYDATYRLLTGGAYHITDTAFSGGDYVGCEAETVPNNVYGYGRLDSYDSVTRARVDVPWLQLPTNVAAIGPGLSGTLPLTFDARSVPGPGTYRARVLVGTGYLSQAMLPIELTLIAEAAPQQAMVRGVVRDAETRATLQARVQTDTGLVLSVDETGRYTITLPVRSEPYTLRAKAVGYTEQTVELNLTSSGTRNMDFNLLTDIPRLSIGPVPTTQVVTPQPITATLDFQAVTSRLVQLRNTNSGSRILTYTLQVPSEPFSVLRSDEAGGPSVQWIELPTSAMTLTLKDDGSSGALPLGFTFKFYNTSFDTVYVASNGMVSFTPFPDTPHFTPGCLPVPDTTGTALVPLRADLDPAQGGSVRIGEVAEGWVVSFEQVPLHSREPVGTEPRFTFQVVIARDGRLVFNYADLDTLPSDVAVGLQGNSQKVMHLGCGTTAPISSNLTLEFQPQPDSQRWLAISSPLSGTLKPDESVTLHMRLAWVMPYGVQPYRSAILIESNDSRQPLVRLPVEITVAPSPYGVWLPILSQGSGGGL